MYQKTLFNFVIMASQFATLLTKVGKGKVYPWGDVNLPSITVQGGGESNRLILRSVGGAEISAPIDEVDRPGLHRRDGEVERAGRAGGDEERRGAGELGERPGAADRVDVGDHDRARLVADRRQRLLRVGAKVRPEAPERPLADQPGERPSLSRIGVDDEHVDGFRRCAADRHLRRPRLLRQ